MAVRQSTVVIALRYKVIAYRLEGLSSTHGLVEGAKGKAKATNEFQIKKIGEWETSENESGKLHRSFRSMIHADSPGLLAIATAPGSSLVAMPGRQAGHVQLVSLSPCISSRSSSSSGSGSRSHQPQFRSPIILAHTHPLSALACTANGSHILTTSERGTLLRVWDTSRGRLERELRRGMDRAEMWGIKFEDEVQDNERGRKGGLVVGWSDKGTIHVWEGESANESSKRSVSSTTLSRSEDRC